MLRILESSVAGENAGDNVSAASKQPGFCLPLTDKHLLNLLNLSVPDTALDTGSTRKWQG